MNRALLKQTKWILSLHPLSYLTVNTEKLCKCFCFVFVIAEVNFTNMDDMELMSMKQHPISEINDEEQAWFNLTPCNKP